MKMRSLELSLWLSSAAESVAAGGVTVDDMLAETHEGGLPFRARTEKDEICLSVDLRVRMEVPEEGKRFGRSRDG